MKKASILIIEDDLSQGKIFEKYLAHHGYRAKHVTNTKSAEGLLSTGSFDVVLVDWRLPEEDGLNFIARVKEKFPLVQFIMVTAFGSIERAVEAMKVGAYQYITKPVNLEELLVIIDKAFKEIELEREVELLKTTLRSRESFEISDIVSESPKMKEVLKLVRKIAETDITVLILGESGTGKEVIANLIYTLSPRNDKPFLKINCAAIPEGLLESELFGHEKGAFTGADRLKIGLFEMVKGGTLFLDEIGDMPLSLQSKLLRVLQDGTFIRVGGTKEIKVDVRIITATNRNLEQMVREGRFREDLYWRLNVFPIKLPPLRERREDILPLANYFLKRCSQKLGKRVVSISREAGEKLINYQFPGNIRELEHLIERAVILSEGEILTSYDLKIGESSQDFDGCFLERAPSKCPFWTLPLVDAVKLLESKRIKDALEKSGGVKTKAAELLGISERVLRYKLEHLD